MTTSFPDDGVEGVGGAKRFSLRRLAISYPATIALLITLNFLLPRAMPGNPLAALEDQSSPTYVTDSATRGALARFYGLNEPLPDQFVTYLGGLVHGNLGTSITYSEPVTQLIEERLPWTLLLLGSALALATSVGLLAGIHSGWRHGRRADRGMLVFFLGVNNFPAFFLASLAVFLFAVKLRWFPLAGSVTPFSDSFGVVERVGDIAYHLALPASVLAVQFVAGTYLLMRGSMVSELGSDYLLLGRAKGLRERRLKYSYAARNALLPVVTILALQLSFAVSGDIFVESVFDYPGMGRLVFDAIGLRDYPTLQGCFLVLTLSVVTINFLVDLLYGRLDPRTVG